MEEKAKGAKRKKDIDEDAEYILVSRVTAKYGIRIPKRIREEKKIRPGDVVKWIKKKDGKVEVRFYQMREYEV